MQNAITPGREAEGVVCLLGGYDTDALTITALRLQHLSRLGIPLNRAAIIASLAFGEVRHA